MISLITLNQLGHMFITFLFVCLLLAYPNRKQNYGYYPRLFSLTRVNFRYLPVLITENIAHFVLFNSFFWQKKRCKIFQKLVTRLYFFDTYELEYALWWVFSWEADVYNIILAHNGIFRGKKGKPLLTNKIFKTSQLILGTELLITEMNLGALHVTDANIHVTWNVPKSIVSSKFKMKIIIC